MLEERDLAQIRRYVTQILPELLRQDPEVATIIEGILAQQFPRRDEFARLLDELTKLREDMNQRFEQSREEMNRRFEQVDHRFEQSREEMNRRFEQVDRRFEQVDQRFEQMHQTQLGMKQDIVQLQSGQERILTEMGRQENWLRFTIGQLGREKGRELEDTVAAALQYGLKNPGIKAENLRLRQKLVDHEGRYYAPGSATEVDLIVENDKLIVFEVKSAAEVGDVDLFAQKVTLMATQNPDKHVQGVFITLGVTDELRQRCAQYGLTLAE